MIILHIIKVEIIMGIEWLYRYPSSPPIMSIVVTRRNE